MPASFLVSDGNVTIRMDWTGPLARFQEIVFGSAQYSYDHGMFVPMREVDGEQVPIPFDELSAQQKLDIIYQYTGYLHTEQAKAAKVDTDVAVARDAAIVYAEENYDLG